MVHRRGTVLKESDSPSVLRVRLSDSDRCCGLLRFGLKR